ncbi:MAG: hypothetical protein IJ379_04260, partial [Lachnospiraceae bacterium]|nr:hypothetical protein [Lachnospiraceae bacterium]
VQDISDPSEKSATFTYDETVMDTVSLFLRVNTGVTVDVIAKPMLQLGSEATEWEPYVGGTVSPNPDYPQDIQNVDITEVKSCCKNLFDISQYANRTNKGVTATIENQTMILNGTGTDAGALPSVETKPFPFKAKVGDILTISTTILSGSATIASNTSLGFCVIRVNKEEVTRFHAANIVSGEIDKNTKLKPESLVITEDMISDDGFVYHTTQVYVRAGDVYNNLVLGIQIELNSEATEWEPYKSSTSAPAITARAIEVSADDDYTYEKDGKYYVADTVERTDEGYQLVQRIGECVFDGVANLIHGINILDNAYGLSFYSNSNEINNNAVGLSGSFAADLLCTHFVPGIGGYNSGGTTDLGNIIYRTKTNVWFSIQRSIAEANGITSAEGFNTWLQSNPITVHYILAEPIITQLSDADAIQLLSLKTFDSVTHISTDSAVEPVIETKYGISEVGARTLRADNTALRAELRAKALEASAVNNI